MSDHWCQDRIRASALAPSAWFSGTEERGDAAVAAEHVRTHVVRGGTYAIEVLDHRGFWED